MSTTLVGRTDCRADERGRLRLPSQIVSRHASDGDGKFMLQLGIGEFLVLYPMSTWEKEAARYLELDSFDDDEQELKQMFFQMSEEVSLDGNNRFQIPKHLSDLVGIERDLVITGQGDRYYVRSMHNYEKLAPTPKRFAELAKRVRENRKANLNRSKDQ